MEQEWWKPVPEFDGYEASDQGRIRSYRKRGGGRREIAIPLKPSFARRTKNYGIAYVCLRKDGKTYHCSVASLVLLTFIGPKPDGMEVCHEDSDSHNNRLDNLRYDSHQGNMQDWKDKTRNKVAVIRRKHHRGTPFTTLAREYDLREVYIRRICHGDLYPDAAGPTVNPHKLSDKDVLEIRQRRAAGESLSKIGEVFNISISMVSRISSGKRRADIGGPLTVGKSSSN